MPVPNIFASATSPIPLSQLDQNFATNATLGNATVGLGNTTTSVGNLTLNNPTISAGTINNNVIGGTTAAAITGTTITANTAFRGTDFGSGSASTVNITTTGGTQLAVTNYNSAVNNIQITGAASTGAPTFTFTGSDTNVTGLINTKGSSSNLYLQIGSTTTLQLSGTGSAVNNFQMTSAATTGSPVLAIVGADTNISLFYYVKGSGSHRFMTNAGSQEQFRVTHVDSAVNYIDAYGAATGSAPAVKASGSDTNIDLSLNPKAAGMVQMNSAGSWSTNGAVATSLGSVGPTGSHTTVQRWLTVKDNLGTTLYIPCF